MLDELAPPHRRAEIFAVMRTRNALGIIAIRGLLALADLQIALIGSMEFVGTFLIATCATFILARRRSTDQAGFSS
ncbi:hypothetical protein [Microbacterium enclense]|uniref:hypothetical protein n=1 Tax=Microbacterium enclense TaxID=993073 RepID=UPI003F80B17B